MNNMDIKYGPVFIIKGKYKDRIGYYDDDEGEKAIVYISGPPCGPGGVYKLINPKYLIQDSGLVYPSLDSEGQVSFYIGGGVLK